MASSQDFSSKKMDAMQNFAKQDAFGPDRSEKASLFSAPKSSISWCSAILGCEDRSYEGACEQLARVTSGTWWKRIWVDVDAVEEDREPRGCGSWVRSSDDGKNRWGGLSQERDPSGSKDGVEDDTTMVDQSVFPLVSSSPWIMPPAQANDEHHKIHTSLKATRFLRRTRWKMTPWACLGGRERKNDVAQ